MPRHKGKIESGVKYVKRNALKARTIREPGSGERLPAALGDEHVADKRIHGTTQQQVGKRFGEERAALGTLPLERFPFFHESQRTVHRDGHVQVDRSYYSAPPEYLRQDCGSAGTAGWCGSSISR